MKLYCTFSGQTLAALAVFAAMTQTLSAEPRKSAQSIRTVDSIVEEVLANNPEIAAYDAKIAAARGEHITARSWDNPELTTSAGNKHVASGQDGLAWTVELRQTFEWPGRRRLRDLLAERKVKLAELALAQFRAALGSEARAAAFDLLAAQEQAAAVKEVRSRYAALQKVLAERDTPGVNPLLDRRIIEATVFGLSRQATDAEVASQRARIRLNELRGAPFGEALGIKSYNAGIGWTPSLTELIAAAKVNNFDLLIAEAELKEQSLRVDLVRNQRNPSFAVGPYFSNERTGAQETQVGVAFSVPLTILNHNEGAIATEEASKKQSQIMLGVAERRVERELSENFEIYSLRRSELSASNQHSVKTFKDAAALADEHYRLGAVPVATYVELQKQYLDAVNTSLEVQRAALEARQKLELISGMSFDAPRAKRGEVRP